jgi:cytosine/adenosine deaminase-related metal-dependent hydrolase
VVVADVVMASADVVHSPGWVTIDDGAIVAVGSGPPPPGPVVARGDLVMPGLVSAHQHAVDLLVAGGPTGPTFLDWLLGTYHHGLSFATPSDCALAVGAVRAATLAAGVTTMVDCWSVGPVDDETWWTECADASVEAHTASGGRTVVGVMGNEHPAPSWAGFASPIEPSCLCRPADEWLAAVEGLASRWADDRGRTRLTPSPELPETSTARGLAGALALAEHLGTALPMHLCASPPSRAAYGPDELERDGLAGPRILAAHVSSVDGADVVRLGRAGIGVAHCPSSARALGAARLTPVRSLRGAGARVGIGLDNASLHPGRDLFAEARQAALAATVVGAGIEPHDLYALLTSEGADVAGLSGEVGRLTPGLRADLLVLDTSGAHWWPRRQSWPETVTASATAADVRTVMVDGRVVARDGVATTGVDGPALDAAAVRIRNAAGWG